MSVQHSRDFAFYDATIEYETYFEHRTLFYINHQKRRCGGAYFGVVTDENAQLTYY
jgi:hypothetical protein